MSWYSRCSWCEGQFNGRNCCHCTNVSFRDEPVYDSNPNSYNQTPKFSYPHSQPQTSSFDQFHCFGSGDPLEEGYSIDHQEDLNQQRISDVHDRWDKLNESWNELLNVMQSFCEMTTNLSTYSTKPSRRYNSFCYDDDDYEESTITLNKIISQISPSIVITSSPTVLPIEDFEDSLIMGNEELSIIPKKESDEFIKSSVEDLVPILNESEDTSGNDSDDNKSLSDKDVSEDKVKIYPNPFFEFDEEYISSDVNPLFDEVLENIKNKDSYDSNPDEPDLLVTPIFDANEDECFNPGDDVDEIELLLHCDPSTPKMSVAFILEGFTNEPPLEENDDLFDLESKENEWKKILYEAPIDDLMTEDKVFDPRIHEKFFSPTYVRLYFRDRHYLFFTYVIRIFLLYFTYPVDSPFHLSSGSEDTIFDPGIFAFYF
uniref:Pre-mRNA splicing Prp18-interacting factor n=1 Tax=Tanacetum cinerariifolium TaxID=118510 RepID=A0A6L2KQK3_TANCI|nr:hypothetical protein [Tanacetum cinerariifolium]GEV60794.1 hypothetical protein [Tanacetum cinerariifolium]